MKFRLYIRGLALLLFCSLNPWVVAAPLTERPDVQAFISQMVQQYSFNSQELTRLLDTVQLHEDVVSRKSIPYSAKPWNQYQKFFVNPTRIEDGVKFWQTNQQVLTKVEQAYGVPASVITAILGIETNYGRSPLKYRAIDSLASLAFNYPPRSAYFTKELREFLLLTREQGIDPLSVKSSYDGGLGLPQFMPSSYRAYGVEIDGDKRADLINSIADSIASIANYLKQHGWQPKGYIAVPFQTSVKTQWPYQTIPPQLTIAQLLKEDVHPIVSIRPSERANRLSFPGEDKLEHWLIFNNFYVITHYNTSPMYALAVYQLSKQLSIRYQQEKINEKL